MAVIGHERVMPGAHESVVKGRANSVVESVKVGVLARRTGLSVRALHHYDAIGLLKPSEHTSSGHRLYTYADIQRLQQIQSLRSTGMPLDGIRHLLDGGAVSAKRVIQLHLARLEEQLTNTRLLTERLKRLARHLETAAEVPLVDLVQIIEGTIMMEKYFTAEQLAELKARGEQLGKEKIKQAEDQWAEIIPAVREHMARGTSADDAGLQALAMRWRELVNEFTGGNKGIAASVRQMYDQEHAQINALNPNTPDPSMFAFMKSVFDKIGGGPG